MFCLAGQALFSGTFLTTKLKILSWKEFCLAKFLALFASWRLMRDSTLTAKAPRTPRNAKEISLVAAPLRRGDSLRLGVFVVRTDSRPSPQRHQDMKNLGQPSSGPAVLQTSRGVPGW